MTRARAARQNGMTLVEVLVAFAILSGVVVGVMALISQNTRFIISAEERLLASIAADNLMTAELARRAMPDAGVEDGVATVASYEFSYSRSVVDLSGDLAQIEFVVRSPHGEQNITRIMALKGE